MPAISVNYEIQIHWVDYTAIKVYFALYGEFVTVQSFKQVQASQGYERAFDRLVQ